MPNLATFDAWWKERFGSMDTRMKYAKTEAILASALASIGADGGSFHHLNRYNEGNILWWDALKNACREVFELGADLLFVERLLFLYDVDPNALRALAVLERVTGNNLNLPETAQRVKKLPEIIQTLETLIASPAFVGMTSGFQQSTRNELAASQRELTLSSGPFFKASDQADVDDPLLAILDHDSSTSRFDPDKSIARFIPSERKPSTRPKRKPAYDLATLVMVLLSDHLRERPGKPCYKEVGHFALMLFPGCLSDTKRRDAQDRPPTSRLVINVRDRCKKFKAAHDVIALRKAVMRLP
jgi:hypothetical protein